MKTKSKLGRPFSLPPTELQKWINKYGVQNCKPRSILFVLSAIESELIKEEDEFAAQLLYNSMESRINSCKYGQGVYVGVYCDWDNTIAACTDIITKKQKFWEDYCEMAKNFLRHDQKQAYRPTIDRINEDPAVGYRLNNIAVLSHGDNARKALSKPHYVFELSLDDPFNLQKTRPFKKYSSKQEAIESLGLKFKGDTGRVYEVNGIMYLIQSEGITLGQKELDVDLNEDTELMKAWIPIGVLRNEHGEEFVLRQEIAFPTMKVILKEYSASKTNNSKELL